MLVEASPLMHKPPALYSFLVRMTYQIDEFRNVFKLMDVSRANT